MDTLLDTRHPYRVPSTIGAVDVIVTTSSAPILPAIQARMTASPAPIALRIAGGCSGMSDDDKQDMLAWFYRNMHGFKGLLSSGGTRDIKDGRLDPMVTDVPAMLASDQVLTISTLPLVGTMQLVDDSRLRISRTDQYGTSLTHPNPGVHMLVVVQHPLGTALGWDGDVRTYFDMLNMYHHQGHRNPWQVGLVAWNGGSVTELEIKLAARYGWPVILVEGSGRAADKFITAMRDGTLDLAQSNEHSTPYNPRIHNIYVVRRDEPNSLRAQLEALNLMV